MPESSIAKPYRRDGNSVNDESFALGAGGLDEHGFGSPGKSETAWYLQHIQGYRQVTDATLVAIARANGGKLATFDQKLMDLFGPDALEIIAS